LCGHSFGQLNDPLTIGSNILTAVGDQNLHVIGFGETSNTVVFGVPLTETVDEARHSRETVYRV